MYGQVWQIALHPEITATSIQSAYLLHLGWLALSFKARTQAKNEARKQGKEDT